MDQFVYVTFANLDEARILGRALVEAHLAGCVNIFPAMESVYSWNGEICEESEVVMVAKTVSGKLADFTVFVKEHHSYSTPCIASFRVEHQNPDYAKWLRDHLSE
jgi:periplasmic divalent cation tolerance protein